MKTPLKYYTFCLLFLIFHTIVFSPPCYAVTFSAAGVRMKKPVKTWKQIKRKNVTIQSLDFSCGAAGLATIFQYYFSDQISEKEIISALLALAPIEKVMLRRGFSLLDLKNLSEKLGYKVTGYQMDVEFLRKIDGPVLVPVKFKNYRHFIIVKRIIGNRVFIADPAVGNASLTIHQFEQMWTNGIGLVIKSEHNPQKHDLMITRQSLIMTDAKYVKRLMSQSALRTAIFPTEY